MVTMNSVIAHIDTAASTASVARLDAISPSDPIESLNRLQSATQSLMQAMSEIADYYAQHESEVTQRLAAIAQYAEYLSAAGGIQISEDGHADAYERARKLDCCLD